MRSVVNDKSVGKHRGGNTPFSFDVSSAVKPGTNSLVVRVEDATEKYQLRGKQVINANGIWYTQVSGIWQTVWLETVPKSFIDDLHISTDANKAASISSPISMRQWLVPSYAWSSRTEASKLLK